MKEQIKIEQLEDVLEISTQSFLGMMKVKYKGEKLKKVAKFEYTLETESGEILLVSLKRRLWGIDLPHVSINGEEVIYIRDLGIIEKIILLSPIVFMVLFGALTGGIFAAFTFVMTVSITRTFRNQAASIFTNILITIGMAFLAMVASTMIYLMIGEPVI